MQRYVRYVSTPLSLSPRESECHPGLALREPFSSSRTVGRVQFWNSFPKESVFSRAHTCASLFEHTHAKVRRDERLAIRTAEIFFRLKRICIQKRYVRYVSKETARARGHARGLREAYDPTDALRVAFCVFEKATRPVRTRISRALENKFRKSPLSNGRGVRELEAQEVIWPWTLASVLASCAGAWFWGGVHI